MTYKTTEGEIKTISNWKATVYLLSAPFIGVGMVIGFVVCSIQLGMEMAREWLSDYEQS